MKKTLWPIFSRSMECDKHPGKICKGPKGIRVITVESIRAFFRTSELLKTQSFEKKGKLAVKKILWPIFSRSIENDKGQGSTYKGPEGLSTFVLQVLSLFLWVLRGC